ncbi:MAG: hypothetical protein MUF49_03025 [Oculatellaceae cyanobacterium Prado106]|nr:hypothetical protein [Oculatellaceae cyanobacterium Prado106]
MPVFTWQRFWYDFGAIEICPKSFDYGYFTRVMRSLLMPTSHRLALVRRSKFC